MKTYCGLTEAGPLIHIEPLVRALRNAKREALGVDS